MRIKQSSVLCDSEDTSETNLKMKSILDPSKLGGTPQVSFRCGLHHVRVRWSLTVYHGEEHSRNKTQGEEGSYLWVCNALHADRRSGGSDGR